METTHNSRSRVRLSLGVGDASGLHKLGYLNIYSHGCEEEMLWFCQDLRSTVCLIRDIYTHVTPNNHVQRSMLAEQ